MQLYKLSDVKIGPRQRTKRPPTHIRALAEDIKQRELLHAPVIWLDETGTPNLLVGGCRHAAITLLAEEKTPIRFDGADVPLGYVPTTLFSLESDVDKKQAELSENTLREALSWQDRSRALAEIHEIAARSNPSQTLRGTAEALIASGYAGTMGGASADRVRNDVSLATIVAKHLDDPDVAGAKNVTEAVQIIARKNENAATAALLRRRDASNDKSSIQLSCADALEALPQLASSLYDLILTDPPYGIDVDARDARHQRQTVAHTYEDTPERFRSLLQVLLIQGHRITKPHANCFIFVHPRFWTWTFETAQRAGWTPFPTPIIWDKITQGIGPWQTEGFQRTYDMIFFATKGQRGLHTPIPDVLHFKRVEKTERTHGAEKPIPLLRQLIEVSTIPHDLILDPFAGSGSTLIAARGAQRSAHGFELDKTTYEAAMASVYATEAA